MVETCSLGLRCDLHQFDVAQQLVEPLERVVLALNRDQHLLAATNAFTVSKPERGRAVDQHVVEVGGRVGQARCSRASRATSRDQLDLGAGQVDGGRDAGEAGKLGYLDDHVAQALAFDQQVVDRRDVGMVVDPERGRGIALWVKVDHQHPQAVQRHRRGDVDRGGGLSHAALLIGDGDHPS